MGCGVLDGRVEVGRINSGDGCSVCGKGEREEGVMGLSRIE